MKPKSRNLTPLLATLLLLSLLSGIVPTLCPTSAAQDGQGEVSLHRLYLGYDKATGQRLDLPMVRRGASGAATEDAEVESSMAAGRREQVDPTRITFRSGITIHPQPGMGPGVREALSDSSVQESDRYWLIQFRYPFPTEARTRLEDVGVVFYDYLDVAALYARVPGGAALLLEEMLQAGEVRYVGSIPAEAKVRPALAARAAQSLALEREIVVLTFDEPTPAQVAELGRLMAIEGQLSGPIHVVRGIAPGASILALVNLDSVRWVEEQGGAELGNLDGGMGVGADVVRATGFDGTGVQVMVVDSGIARDGDTYHPDLQGDRILDQYDFQNGDDNAADDYVLNNGHGTHVAGTIGGRYDAGDPNSNHSYQGVAPDVDFLIYRLFGVDNPFDPTWFSLALERATSEGRTAHVSSNSWAQVKSSGVYSVTSEFADAAVRGAFNGHPVNVVAAAMNDAYLVRSPGTGKNVVTVGAVKDGNSAPGTLVWNKYCGDLEYNWPPGERVCYSNHGPIDTDEDGQTRVKPDLVAPGAMITSAAPWYLPFTSDYYFTTHGTSMAAPHVSGAIAQLLDAYSEVWGGWLFDWPEMVKAMLLATAVDVGGDTDLYGHGLLDAYHAITWQPGVDEPMNLWADSVSLSREIQDFDLYVPPGYEEVRVVLTWADPPDATEVVNDLDVLGIKDGEGIWRSGAASLDDTVEYVRMAAGYTPGTWTIRVRATSIADPPQPFALAAHVILAEADLSIRAAPTSVPGAMPAFEAGEEFYLHQYVSNSGYTAGGSYAKLHVPEGFTVVGATVYTQEGYGHWYDASELYHDPDSAPDDRYVALGETLAGFERHVRWLIEIDEGMACGGYPFESTAYWREGGGERSSSTVITQVPVTCEFLYLPLVLRGD